MVGWHEWIQLQASYAHLTNEQWATILVRAAATTNAYLEDYGHELDSVSDDDYEHFLLGLNRLSVKIALEESGW